MIEPAQVGVVVLAAGAASRFGSQKLLARFRGRPLLQHVLDTVGKIEPAEVVVVLGGDAEPVIAGLEWHGEHIVVNPDPSRGLSSSLRIGVAALGGRCAAALIVLGDQPLLRGDVVVRLLEAAAPGGPPVVVPRYDGGGGANPVLIARRGWGLAESATGDRGLGPLLAADPDLTVEVPVEGSNPDVDTPAELEALT